MMFNLRTSVQYFLDFRSGHKILFFVIFMIVGVVFVILFTVIFGSIFCVDGFVPKPYS
jgi:hypothetical protein